MTKQVAILAAVFSILVLSLTQISGVDAAVYYPTDDTYIDGLSQGANYGSYGDMKIRNRYGGTPDNFELDALIKFDLSSIPSGVPITSATLYLYYYDSWGASWNRDLNIWRLTGTWAESTVTYNTRPSKAATPTSSTPVPGSEDVWVSWDVTSDVQDFVEGTEDNHGWMIMDNNYWGDVGIPTVIVYTKEFGSLIPYLEVEWLEQDSLVYRAKRIARPVPVLQESESIVLDSLAVTDTFFYGATVWNSIKGRPEADVPNAAGWSNRKMWTWSPSGYAGTPHSGLNMDGWTGVDKTGGATDYFGVQDVAGIGSCVISGGKSLFCGITSAQCIAHCYSDLNNAGYGNLWDQAVGSHGSTYNVGDALVLSYKYANETEPMSDYSFVTLQIYDSFASEWVHQDTLATYEGIVSGTEVINLASYLTAVGSCTWRVAFHFKSDEYGSDEDGYYPTTCGACAFDSVTVSGSAVNWYEDFESTPTGSLPVGWSDGRGACGDFARTWHINDLIPPLSLDPCIVSVPNWCEIADSVIAFIDPSDPVYTHPLCQDNYVQSPIIDISDHYGLSGRVLSCERFASLPLHEYVFMYWMVSYYPCDTGGWSPWCSDNLIYYTPEGCGCRRWDIDVSGNVPCDAQEIRCALGVVNYCADIPGACTFTCNATPYYDNVTFAVFGDVNTPQITMREVDYLQDQFAADGSLNPVSTAKTTTANQTLYLHYLQEHPSESPIFGDSLVCNANCDSLEVYLVFRMAKIGPLQPIADRFFTEWFPSVLLGNWQEARMDTAQHGDMVIQGAWSSTFHEADGRPTPYVEGTEILPDDIFVAGTRIEYFIKAKYTGHSNWFFLPDTTGGTCEEFEVLPMMRDDGMGSVEWPCLIVADHFGRRGNWNERNSDRMARHLDVLGYEFDVYNKIAASGSTMNGIARPPGTSGPGATLGQFVAYRHCILNAGNIRLNCIGQQDVDMLQAWLVTYSNAEHSRSLWISGDQICRELYRNVPWGRTFLSTVLCATYLGWSYSDIYSDFTYCLPVNGVVGAIYCTPKDYYVRSNGCPRRLNEIGVSGVGGCGAAAEVEYDSQGPSALAGISNSVSIVGGANYKTYTEGYDFCLIRDNDSLWPGSCACGPDNFIATWMSCVLGWFGCVTSECGPGMVVDVGEPGVDGPAYVSSLSQSFPNPMNPVAKIQYSIGSPGKVTLRVFDVSGRVVRTLVNDTRDAGEYSVVWDGKNDRGKKVGSGVFFYQLEAPDFKSTKKIVILQ